MDSVIPNLQEFNVEGGSLPAPGGGMAQMQIGAGDDSYRWMYYRRPDGYITIAPSWPTEFQAAVFTGMTPLPQYGFFWLKNAYQDGTVWNAHLEPWRQIFLLGGAKEFSREQIGIHGWHRKPPYRGIKFPQLADDPITDVKCPQCGRLFIEQEHMVRHESIAHRDAAANNQFSRSIADAMVKSQVDSSSPIVQMMLAMQQQMQQTALINERLISMLNPVAAATVAVPDESDLPSLPNLDEIGRNVEDYRTPAKADDAPKTSDYGLTDEKPGKGIGRLTKAQ